MNPEEFMPAIAIAALVMMFLIPLTLILTKHQQKMASLLNGQRPLPDPAYDEHVLRELMELRQVVAQQAIALDSLAEAQRKLALGSPTDDVRERLTSV